LAQRKHLFLNSSGRIKGFSVWESLCFVLNGLVFMIIGLALPTITKGLGNVSVSEAIGYGVLITVVLMVSRILSAYGAVVTTLIARNFITVAEKRNPGYKAPLVIGWAGMRGVVSLAAALSIPETLENGAPFPQRNLILFITFIVILLTLLIQGLTLPILIKKINLLRDNEVLPGESHYQEMYRKLTNQSLEYLHPITKNKLQDSPF
jgi:CPA1 family monovalent cation:H+ antiporter